MINLGLLSGGVLTRVFTSDPGLNSMGQLSDPVYLKPNTASAIKKYSFPEANLCFNLYASFRNRIDYQLMQFGSSSKI